MFTVEIWGCPKVCSPVHDAAAKPESGAQAQPELVGLLLEGFFSSECVSAYLFACLFACLFVCFVCLFVRLFVCVFGFLLFVFFWLCLFVWFV